MFPVVTLSTQDNSKLFQQLKSGFKRVINWNRYLSKSELLRRNLNLNRWLNQAFKESIDFLFYHLKMIYKEQVLKAIIFQM